MGYSVSIKIELSDNLSITALPGSVWDGIFRLSGRPGGGGEDGGMNRW